MLGSKNAGSRPWVSRQFAIVSLRAASAGLGMRLPFTTGNRLKAATTLVSEG
jgi:hypothetical protein